jgi:hypothetical protein
MLPIFQTSVRELSQMQTQWSKQINPALASPIYQGQQLEGIALVSGANVVNHGLGRVLQGWWVVRQRSSASIYDTQDSNQMPQLTLTLNSSAPVSVDLWVY